MPKKICLLLVFLLSSFGVLMAQTTITINTAPLTGSIDYAGDEDLYQFTVSSPGDYHMETWVSGYGGGTLGDTYMWLYGPNDINILITYNDDGGLGFSSLIYRNLAVGTYYLKVRPYSPGPTGTYKIAVTKTVALPLNQHWLAAEINPNGDTDFYRVALYDDKYVFETNLGTLYDNYMYLYGPNDPTVLITQDSNAGAGNAALILRTLAATGAAGTYYVRITSGYAGVTGTYKIRSFDVRYDDIAASWTGDATYSRESESGVWTKLTTWANKVALGDYDNDGRADLLATFNDGYLYVRRTSNGAWVKLTTAPIWFAMGDYDADGYQDFFGTWVDGTYVRNGLTGAWLLLTSPCLQLAVGDVDGDTYDDFVGVFSDATYVKFMRTGSWAKLTTPANWVAVGDVNNNRYEEVIGNWPDGIWSYSFYSPSGWRQWAPAALQIGAGDFDGDLIDDIAATYADGFLWVRLSTGIWLKITTAPATFGLGRITTPRIIVTGIGTPVPLTSEVPAIGDLDLGIRKGDPPTKTEADLSVQGPGGEQFSFSISENWMPGSKIDAERQKSISFERRDKNTNATDLKEKK
jgi:hypothetical protein